MASSSSSSLSSSTSSAYFGCAKSKNSFSPYHPQIRVHLELHNESTLKEIAIRTFMWISVVVGGHGDGT